MRKCETCVFGSTAEYVEPADHGSLFRKPQPERRIPVVVCKYMPTPQTKKPDDWCGQHMNNQLLEAKQTVDGKFKVGF